MRTIIIIIFSFTIISCESEQSRKDRIKKIEQQRIEHVRIQKERELKAEKQAKELRIAKELHDKYAENQLSTGDTPYSNIYGSNKKCNGYNCSQIKVKTPQNSDVLVTIKQNEIVVRHAYIRARSSYTFEVPNGLYQPFFYYGKGWNPYKLMKETTQGEILGGFVDSEHFGKDFPQKLNDNILTYELILQTNGNFSTQPSNASEAL